MGLNLNDRAHALAIAVDQQVDVLKAASKATPLGARIVDMGCNVAGGLDAGEWLARICMSGLAKHSLTPGHLPGCPLVQVSTDFPVEACLASQYAGWQISVGKYFAMGSGPMRAA